MFRKEEQMQSFAELLKHYRSRARWSQKELADRMNVSEAVISRIARGQRSNDKATRFTILGIILLLTKEKIIESEVELNGLLKSIPELNWENLNDKEAEVIKQIVASSGFQPDKKIYPVHLKKSVNLTHKIEPARMDGWQRLRYAALTGNEERLRNLFDRFELEKHYYYPRQKLVESFRDFLASDRSIFLLWGKSGTGKTNFILSTYAEFSQDENRCVLLYDGGGLPSEISLLKLITRDLDFNLESHQEPLQHPYNNVSSNEKLISRLQNLTGPDRQILLMVDALNENEQPVALLGRVEELLTQLKNRKNFKIIICTRPETWRIIQHKVNISETSYYHPDGPLSFTSNPYDSSVGIELTPFSDEELPGVYEKYRSVYGVQSEFESIRPPMRSLLRDPLTLKLMAVIYSNKFITTSFNHQEIYSRYIEQLIREGRLQPEDLEFLENYLVPLMLSEWRYSNSITYQQIKSVNIEGKPLHRLLQGGLKKSTGYQRSFLNLLDCDILLTRGSKADYEVSFRYERLYEYFASRRLYLLAADHPSKVIFYLEKIEQAYDKPFMWGVVKNALVRHGEEANWTLLLELAQNSSESSESMLINVLTELGQAHLSQVEALVKDLLGLNKQSSSTLSNRWATVKKLVSQAENNGPVTAASKIAIQVAGELNLIHILEVNVFSPRTELRTLSIQSIYHLWKRDQASGFRLLNSLANRIMRGPLPDRRALEVLVNLAATIFLNHRNNSSAMQELRGVMRRVISEIFVLEESASLWRIMAPNLRRKLMVKLVIQQIQNWLRGMPPYNRYNLVDVASFFTKLAPSEKELFRRLCLYLDPAGAYSYEKMELDLQKALHVNNLFMDTVVGYILTSHFSANPEKFLSFIESYYEQINSLEHDTYYYVSIQVALNAFMYRHPNNDAAFELFKRVSQTHHEYYARRRKISGYENVELCPGVTNFSIYCLVQYEREGTVDTEWLRERIKAGLAWNRSIFIQAYLSEMTIVGIEFGKPKVALAALNLILNEIDQTTNAYLQAYLTRLRLYHPNEVNVFLENQPVPEHIKQAVLNSRAEESTGYLIGGMNLWNFIRDDVITDTPWLRNCLIDIYLKMADCANLEEWLSFLVQYLINLIYGKPILELY